MRSKRFLRVFQVPVAWTVALREIAGREQEPRAVEFELEMAVDEVRRKTKPAPLFSCVCASATGPLRSRYFHAPDVFLL